MISQREFERCLAYVRRTGAHTEVETSLRSGQGGRPRALGVDVLLAAMVLAAQHRRSLALSQVHELLTNDLSRHAQTTYGIRSGHHSLTIRQVRYLFNAVTDLYEHTENRRPDMSPAEREEARNGLGALMDRITGAASQVIGFGDRHAVDATAIESAARGRKAHVDEDLAADGDGPARGGVDAAKFADTEETDDGTPEADQTRRTRSWDPDARWGYRTRTYDNKTNLMFGYQMIALTRVGSVAGEDVPLVTERIRVVPGNDSRGLAAVVDVLDDFHQEGHPVKEVLSDRAYTYANLNDWAAPLAERGIAQVLDMHENDRGSRPDPALGWVMIDGWPHVEGTPDHLVNIQRPERLSVPRLRKSATKAQQRRRERLAADLERFQDLIAERRRYAFEKYGRTKAGTQRWRSPGHAGKLRCPGNPDSMHLGDHVPRCVHPTRVPPSCEQVTVAVPERGIALKLKQDDYWGSPEWITSFNRRVRVEGGFGLLKSARSGNIRRGWTHQVGLVKTSLLLAIAVAAQNLKRLIAWCRRTGEQRDSVATKNITDHGFVELDANGDLIGNLPPPDEPVAA